MCDEMLGQVHCFAMKSAKEKGGGGGVERGFARDGLGIAGIERERGLRREDV